MPIHDVSFSEVVRLVTLASSLADRFRFSFREVVDRFEGAPDTAIVGHTGTRHPRTVARTLLQARARRSEVMGVDVFRDPAWDILLDLYANTEPGETMMISVLCQAAGAPPTTALRYVYKLIESGLLLSEDHPLDQRRTMVRLAPGTAERIEHLLAIIGSGA
ncbi:MarR family transcriptional regulator [Sphingomonas sp.]|uniref:MarR family transcriptional regulator n=1 Tax=Sphingomonas sp. TaxID=28214 RepID=UPI000DB457DF|nr:MarR family transcriptional regulator [Sphingomonas sp.]PZU10363.1 MAG: MarR family transcriptional regulator [Sphingomonas sp.]